jgi:hypothetical protein
VRAKRSEIEALAKEVAEKAVLSGAEAIRLIKMVSSL